MRISEGELWDYIEDVTTSNDEYSCIKVKFQGLDLIWIKNTRLASGPLSPLDHFDEYNRLRPDCMLETSYAHVWPDGNIWKVGKIIGTTADLEILLQ